MIELDDKTLRQLQMVQLELLVEVDRICKKLNFTSLRFHRLDDMIKSVGIDKCKLCTYCWDGKE